MELFRSKYSMLLKLVCGCQVIYSDSSALLSDDDIAFAIGCFKECCVGDLFYAGPTWELFADALSTDYGGFGEDKKGGEVYNQDKEVPSAYTHCNSVWQIH